MKTRLPIFGLLLTVALSSACSNGLQTKVRTVSDAYVSPNSSYALVLSQEQTGDIESRRLARSVRANLIELGFEEKPAEDAAYHVRFAVASTGKTSDSGGSTTTMHYPVSHARTSQASVAGVAVPGTQTTTVHYDTAVSHSTTTKRRSREQYRLEISFLDNQGDELRPVHKTIVNTETSGTSLQAIAPCLVDAAFQQFPGLDGGERKVAVTGCS